MRGHALAAGQMTATVDVGAAGLNQYELSRNLTSSDAEG